MASLNATAPVTSDGGPPYTNFHLDDSLGVAFIGLIFAAILSGITYIQSISYFQSSSRDPKYVKGTVALLWLLDAFHLALISHLLYFFLVTNFSNPSIINHRVWSLCLQVVVTTISDFIIRLFFVRRLWIMSKRNRFLTTGLLIFTFVTFAFGMAFGIKIFSYSMTFEFTDICWLMFVKIASAVVADLWAAVLLCYFLAKSRSGFKATDTKVNKLILYIVSTGLLTSFCAIGTLISFAVNPRNFVFIGFFFSLSKLYFNSLLATLNARGRLDEGTTGLGGNMGVYNMPRILHLHKPSTLKDVTSLNSISDSLERTGSNSGEDDNHELVVSISVRTETEYHVDEVGTRPDRCASVLPL